jgi:cysteine-rich repeat protein
LVGDTVCAIGTRELPRGGDALACLALHGPSLVRDALDLSRCAASGGSPTPGAPTPTATVTPARTASPTVVVTVSAAATATVAPTTSPLLTTTPTAASTATSTAVATVQASPTPTRTATPSASPTTNATATVVPTSVATPVRTATTTPVPTVTPILTATPVRTATTTPVPTTTPVLTATAAPTTTRTPTPAATSTPSGPVCGNGVQEAGESCDDGNTSNCDTCPKSCVASTAPVACSATTVRHAQRVRLQAPTGAVLSGGQLCLDYPSGVVALPGTGNVTGRTSNLSGLVTLNDFNNAVQLTFVANPGAAQVNPTVSFDLCSGQTAPLPAAFSCEVKSASNAGTAIDPSMVACTPIAIP